MKDKNNHTKNYSDSEDRKDKKEEKEKVPPFPPGDPYAPPADIEDPQKVIPKTVMSQQKHSR